MMKNNYRELYTTGYERLEKAGIVEAKLDARLLLEHACGTDHNTLLVHPEREVTEDEYSLFTEYIERREKREPVAYIIGKWDFMGLSFNVSQDVLIPEQDTEILVEEALRFVEDGMRIMDLCTGSGCIALSLLHYTNDTRALCTDISERALLTAKANCDMLGLKGRAEFVKADVFPEGDVGKVDIIVSNPPYIASAVIDSLAPEVKDYEPRLALDGDEDGLKFYRRIIDETGKYLYSSGFLIMEIGYDQQEAVRMLLENNGKFHDIEIIKDYSGNDRVVRACYY